MENAVNTVVFHPMDAEVVARDVQDDQSLEILELDDLLNITEHVVAHVQLHQTLQVFKAVEPRDLVVLQRELRQRHQLRDVLDAADAVLSQVQLLQVLELFDVLDDGDLVFFQVKLL